MNKKKIIRNPNFIRLEVSRMAKDLEKVMQFRIGGNPLEKEELRMSLASLAKNALALASKLER